MGMTINLSPQRRDDGLAVSVAGEVLTINGDAVDLSGVTEGAFVDPGNDWIVGDVTRTSGDLILTLIIPHGADAEAGTLFPAQIVDPANGSLTLPPPSP